MKNLNHEQLIGQWHRDRNLIDGSTDKDQYMKLIQEAGELSDSLCKGKDIKDDIGDMMVVLINIMVRNNLTIEECLAVAYEDIKDRKGKMIDGIFVKEGDEYTQMFITILFIYLAVGLIWGLFDPKKIISSEVNKLRFENIARIASNQEVKNQFSI